MKVLVDNRKALRDYEVMKEYEAGIELRGFEVKALKAGKGSLRATHVKARGGEAFLVGMTIPPYQAANTPEDYDPDRSRRLLLSRKELEEIEKQEEQKGLTIVPISVYNNGRKLKVKIAVVRGLKKYDKREKIKRRDTERDIGRSLKNR